MAGAPVTTEESSVKWKVPFRMKKMQNFEVRLGPPGGDKVSSQERRKDLAIISRYICRATRLLLEWILHSSICVGGLMT